MPEAASPRTFGGCRPRACSAFRRVRELEQLITLGSEAPRQLLAEGRQPLPCTGIFPHRLDAAPPHAILNATATVFTFELFGRNPKMITRWLSHVMTARQNKITKPGRPDPEIKRQ